MMTITRTIRKRLRRYALFCLMAATTAGAVETAQPSNAGETHDSSQLNRSQACDSGWSDSDLCGWIEELSATTSSPQVDAELPQSSEIFAPQFLTVTVSDELSINTCTYGTWLAGNLSQQPTEDASVVEQIEPEISSEIADGNDRVDTDPQLARLDEDDVDAPTHSRTSSKFNTTIAAIAAAATAGNPIPFSQWTEPFAMVGPGGSHTPREIKTFQTWFGESKRFVAQYKLNHPTCFVPVVDFDGEIDDQPSETHPFDDPDDGILLVETAPSDVEARATLSPSKPTDRLVGSSPIIATIIATIVESDSQSDLAADDAIAESIEEKSDRAPEAGDSPKRGLVWAGVLFSPMQQPFQIRSFNVMRESGWSPLAKNTEAVPVVEFETDEVDRSLVAKSSNLSVKATDLIGSPAPVKAEPTGSQTVAVLDPLVVGSAECWLDELVWQVGAALDDESVTDHWLRPERIGQEVALILVSRERLATRLASELAQIWPADAGPANPIPGVGARLLARAEAAEQLQTEGSAEPAPEQQLAQASAILLQWVDVAESVIDDFYDRVNDVTEVARNRGTQDESIRR